MLMHEWIKYRNAQVKRARTTETGKELLVDVEGREERVEGDEILIGAGRAPNVEGLNLEGVGVEHDPRHGVKVNDHLQTTNPRIYAAGDVCMAWKFTHAADAAALALCHLSMSPIGRAARQLNGDSIRSRRGTAGAAR